MDTILLLLLLVTQYNLVTSDCNTVFTGIPTFGPDCEHKCHCSNGATCNETTGECPDGCRYGWTGPECQFRNVAKGYLRVISQGYSSATNSRPKNAVDGKDTTFVYSNINAYSGNNFWKIELNRAYHIERILIHIPKSDNGAFKYFQVDTGNNYDTIDQLCYLHPEGVQANLTMDIVCSEPVYTQYVQITINKPNVRIAMSEVEIISGREVSFNQATSQSTVHGEWNSDKAVDGRQLKAGETSLEEANATCFSTNTDGETSPWWSMDLGGPYVIQEIHVFGRLDNINDFITGFYISVGNSINDVTEIFYDDPPLPDAVNDYQPRVVQLNESVTAQFVKIGRTYYNGSTGPLQICEVKIFGSCPPDRCGWNCSTLCYCKTSYLQHLVDGICPVGCSGRWSSAEYGFCNYECTDSTWGQSCMRQCGNCGSASCDSVYGTCDGECSGTLQPPFCQDECSNGTFGPSCMDKCGQCENSAVCDRTTGHCPDGCVLGWQEPTCLEQCDYLTYGGMCTPCGNCLSNTVCDQVTGHCPEGCLFGYQPPLCHEYCYNGTYGDQCSNTCGDCYGEEQCNMLTGLCESGVCDPGFVEPYCQEGCKNATYGENCTEICGTCEGPPQCHHVTGHCLWGCADGYAGDTCTEVLEEPPSFLNGTTIGTLCTLVLGLILGVFGAKVYIKHKKSIEEEKRQEAYKEKTGTAFSSEFEGGELEQEDFLRSL